MIGHDDDGDDPDKSGHACEVYRNDDDSLSSGFFLRRLQRFPFQTPCVSSLRLDALEVLHCFGEVPITIESHVKSGKGKADFWEAIAANRAELVRPAAVFRGSTRALQV